MPRLPMPRAVLLLVPLLLLAVAAPAAAQEASRGYADLALSMLDPADDWAAEVLRGVLPTLRGGAGEVANQRTVVGHMVGWLSGIVFVVAAAWALYGTLVNIVRISDKEKLLHEGWHWMAAVRMPLALACMFPVPPSGVSFGQVVVGEVAMLGIGSARLVYSEAVKAIGPDAVPIAQPMVPGTRTIVSALLQNELCRALVNAVANNPRMMPPPQPVVTGRSLARNGVSAGAVTWAYALTPGNATGRPVCGSVTVRQPAQTSGATIVGVNVDMTGRQREILEAVVGQHLRPAAERAAQALWQTRQAASLAPLMAAYAAANADYTARLTQAATEVTAQLRAALTADAVRSGSVNHGRNETRLSALGWTFAGSYSLEFGRLSGSTLGLLANTPVVVAPNWEGLGPNVSRDLVPLVSAALNFRDVIVAHAEARDGLEVPSGYSDLFAGASPGDDGTSVLDRVARAMRFSERVLAAFVEAAAPARTFQDPFAAQVRLGHTLMAVSLAALGAAALLASTTGTAAAMAASALTLNFTGVAASAVGHLAVGYLGTPIFYGLMCLLVPGIVLAFVLPLLPFGMWLAGVTGWFILALESWVSVSLWMLSHMTFRGADLHGQGGSGYVTLANLLFRPVLMLIGLFLGYALYAPLAWYLGRALPVAAGFVLQQGWLITNLIGLAVLMCLFILAHMVVSTQCFRMISLVPHHVMAWANMRPANRVDMDQFAQQMGAVGLAGALQNIQGGMNAALESAREHGRQQAALGFSGGAESRDGMDGTLSAATDVVPPREEGRR